MDDMILEQPLWFEKKKLNEGLFSQMFLQDHPMCSVNGTLFTVDGRVDDEGRLRNEIYSMIRPYVTSGLARKVNNLLDLIRMDCYRPDLPLHTDRIHVANGTLFLDGTFTQEKEFCRNRLPVSYNPEAPKPERWLNFLSELLEPTDILTLQEYFGYCLLPTTKAQKMLFLIGQGGEGKSRVGIVLKSLLGSNMNTGSISKVETSPFARADLEHELVLVDDDLKLEALKQTNYIKTIVTAELPMDLERKGQQSYQGDLYVRFLAFGNGTMTALYDRSYGFFRRQIILTTLPRPEQRVDDPFLSEKLCGEAEGIFLWALEGLKRLIRQDYHFTISGRAEENMAEVIAQENNITEFLQSKGYFRFKADSSVTSKALYETYEVWCDANALKPLCSNTFSRFLKDNAQTYNLEYDNHITLPNGREARGFLGIELLGCCV